jgi:hypothetical protein
MRSAFFIARQSDKTTYLNLAKDMPKTTTKNHKNLTKIHFVNTIKTLYIIYKKNV